MGNDSDGAMRRAVIVVYVNSGTEVPRYGMDKMLLYIHNDLYH